MNIAISIIVPVYNVEQYLPRFFDSIKKQTFKQFEVILIDDGSTDNSYKLCCKFAKTSPNVTVIHQNNHGTGITRNRGVKLAKGKYIYFCDPDDRLQSDLLRDNYLNAERFKANCVIFNYIVVNNTGKLIHKNKMRTNFYKNNLDVRKIFPDLSMKGLLNPVWNKLYLAKSIKDISFENVKIGEDTRFNILYFKNASCIYCNSKAYYDHINNRDSSAMNQDQFGTVIYQLEENKRTKELVYEVWGEKNDPRFRRFIGQKYLHTAISALRLGKNVNYNKRVKLLDELIQNNFSEYFNRSCLNGIKDWYYVLILRFRHVPLVLRLDAFIYRVMRSKK